MSEQEHTSGGGTLLSVHIGEVWNRLGGGELQNGRGRAFWRGGDGFNVALDLERGRWFDHAGGVGGGVLALVQTALGSDRRTALAWLRDESFLEARNYSVEERRAYSRRREHASAVARDIEHWRAALTEELNGRKLKAGEDDDFETLAEVAPLCFVLEFGTPEAVAREFFRHREANSERVAALVEAGRERREESRRFAAVVVVLMGYAVGSEAPDAA